MNNAKEIAEKTIEILVPEAPVYILARAYLELEKEFEKEHKLHKLSVSILEKKDYETTKLKEENEGLRQQVADAETPYCPACGSCGVYMCCSAQYCKYPGIKKEQLDAANNEITKLKEENEKIKKSRDVLRKALEFYGDKDNWYNINIGTNLNRLEAGISAHDTNGENNTGGKLAREAIKADDEIFETKEEK